MKCMETASSNIWTGLNIIIFKLSFLKVFLKKKQFELFIANLKEFTKF